MEKVQELIQVYSIKFYVIPQICFLQPAVVYLDYEMI